MAYKFQELPYHIKTWEFAETRNSNRKLKAQNILKLLGYKTDMALKQSKNSVFQMLPYEFEGLKETVKYPGTNTDFKEIISFKNAVVIRTKNQGDFVFESMEHSTNLKTLSREHYFKLAHNDPYWGSLYVFYEDVRFDKPGYKWWEVEENERLLSHQIIKEDDKVVYAVLVSEDENGKTFDHHILNADVDKFKSFIKDIDIFPGLSNYEYERFRWWLYDKLEANLIENYS